MGSTLGDVQVEFVSKESPTIDVQIDYATKWAIKLFSNTYADVGVVKKVFILLKDAEPG